MARYTEAVCRQCRREGEKLFLKGARCYSDKCAMNLRPFAPGQHGKGRKKSSEYGLQLRAKQRARRIYGVLETQFRNYFAEAERKPGQTGTNLLQLLELRLDNVIYRSGFALSRPEARQLVLHGHYTVNGKKVNIPSYSVKVGDVIAITEKSKGKEKIKAILEATATHPAPKWINLDKTANAAKIMSIPSREEIDIPVDEQLIVELYSK